MKMIKQTLKFNYFKSKQNKIKNVVKLTKKNRANYKQRPLSNIDSRRNIEKEIEEELRKEIEKIFETKRKKLGLMAKLDLEFIEDTPIVGKNVYGEAFPYEKPPRIWLQIFAPDATNTEIIEHICHELIHIQHPELNEEDAEFLKKVKTCVNI